MTKQFLGDQKTNNHLLPKDDGLIFRNSGKWVRVKLDYLNRYISVFETAMRRKFNIRFYIDLFSGPGKNRIKSTGEILLGSPLIALTTKYPFTDFIFVESDNNCFNSLYSRCNTSSLRNSIVLIYDDCNRVIDNVIHKIKMKGEFSLNLAFLDPEGLELSWTTVSKLAGIKRIDLIINYPQGSLNRNMKKFYESQQDSVIDGFFGGRDWKEIYLEKKRKNNFKGIHRSLMDLYKDKLHKLGYRQVLRDDETGHEPLICNAERNAPLYRLIFASKHELGVDFWRKITKRDAYGQKRLF